MKRINNLLLTVIIVCIAFGCCVLAACKESATDYKGLNFGKYYLQNSDVYIEIKADNKAILNNLDFTSFDPEAYWGGEENWQNEQVTRDEVIAAMQGEKEYWYFDDDKTLTFAVKSCENGLTYGIEFNYNGTNELEFNGVKYIKDQENTMQNPIATIIMENGGEIKIELYPDKAPNTVNNFISLANSGFYDGIIFHRVISGFMIQGGDPAGVGTGGPGYTIKGEFSLNGFTKNDIKHARGVISMARAYHPDSAGSQFFIMHANASYLDGQYAAFGKVIEGMETVDEIAEVETGVNDKPKVPQVMKSVRVETFGVAYPAPIKAN